MTKGTYVLIRIDMRRRPGQLTSLELSIIGAILSLESRSHERPYGFVIAKEMQRLADARYRVAHGTLYRALERMERAGFLRSSWEDANVALAEGRPRRRYYALTAQSESAYAEAAHAPDRQSLTPMPRGGAA